MKKIKILGLATFVLVTVVVTSCKKKIDPIPTPVDTAIKDASGNVYTTVTIGTQVWLKENLRTTKYNNGDAIPKEETTAWSTLTAGAYCAYGNLESNAVIFGYLYNGYVVNDTRGIAPKGYHVATQADWEKLKASLVASPGNALKQSGALYWDALNTGTNSSGFTALGGGIRNANPAIFDYLGKRCALWTSTSPATDQLVAYVLSSELTEVNVLPNLSVKYGIYVRCVKDN